MSASSVQVGEGTVSSAIGTAKWYAGLAMQSIIAKHSSVPTTESEREDIALWAWRMGQAMVATEKRIHADRAS